MYVNARNPMENSWMMRAGPVMSTPAMGLRDEHPNSPRLAHHARAQHYIVWRALTRWLRSLDRRFRELSPDGLPAVLLFAIFALTFANPGWSAERQVLRADTLKITVDLPRLPRQGVVVPEAGLERPVILPDQGIGDRKRWLLDLNQRDEEARSRARAQRDCEQWIRHATAGSCSESWKTGTRT